MFSQSAQMEFLVLVIWITLRNDCIRVALVYLNLGRWEKEISCLKIANNEITKFGISFIHAIFKDFDSQNFL